MREESTNASADGDDRASSDPAPAGGSSARSDAQPDVQEIRRLIELMRPAIQADGGDVELVEVTDGGVVRVRLHGACVGCPSSGITLQAGIERHLRDRVPGVTRVEPADDPSDA